MSNFGIRSNSQSLEYYGVVSYQTSESVWCNVLQNITIKWLAFLHIWNVPDSNPDVGYTDWDFSWFLEVFGEILRSCFKWSLLSTSLPINNSLNTLSFTVWSNDNITYGMISQCITYLQAHIFNVFCWFNIYDSCINDSSTVNHFCRLVFRGAENSAYIYIHENFHLMDLPWNSAWTWYLALLGVDFCYYWVHRACHGNYLWQYLATSSQQVHLQRLWYIHSKAINFVDAL